MGPQGQRFYPRDVVAELHVHVAFDRTEQYAEPEHDYDEQLYGLATDRLSRLEAGLRDSLAEHLGPEFDVRVDVSVTRSIEIVATVLLVGSLVASYNTVREGLLNVRHDWKWLVERLIDPVVPFPIVVDAYYRMGPAAGLLPVGTAGPAVGGAPDVIGPRRRELPIPSRVLAIAYGLLFVVLLGWLTVPLLLLAGAL